MFQYLSWYCGICCICTWLLCAGPSQVGVFLILYVGPRRSCCILALVLRVKLLVMYSSFGLTSETISDIDNVICITLVLHKRADGLNHHSNIR